MLCSKNALVEEHNQEALEAFPGSIINLYSSTRVELHASSPEQKSNPVREYL